ncbi:MAG: SsrA-binding protein SmpB [Planctomycetes bacterium]|nr:SsrA-binding protein SmpB [Planctomycetota bacterium]
MDKKGDSSVKLVQKNRRAFFDYDILERFEAGLALRGSEVKSIRNGGVSIHEAYGRVKSGEAWVMNMDIAAYAQAGPFNHEPKRPRKLLLKRAEIRKLAGKTAERGLTLIPLSLYFKDGFAKLEIGLARGRKHFDKREAIKKREMKNDLRKRMLKR